MKRIDYIKDLQNWHDSFTFSIPIKVRFSETDLYGHVNNTSVFVYFEEARIEYLESIGCFQGIEEEDGVVVQDLQCHFLKQMFFNDIIDVYVKIFEVGRTSFDLHYMALNQKKEITLTGRGRMVFVDVTHGKSKPIPRGIRDLLCAQIS